MNEIDDLRITVTQAINAALEPITSHRLELQSLMEKEIIKRDAIESRRNEMITQLAQGNVDIKKITKTRTDYDNSDDAVKIYAEAISRVSQELTQFQPLKNKTEIVVRNAVRVLELKRACAEIEVKGQKSLVHEKQLKAQYKGYMDSTTTLFDSMKAMGANNNSTGKALVKLTEAILAFSPTITNTLQPEEQEDDGYISVISNTAIKPEVAA